MQLASLAYPAIDPVAFRVGPLALHWYALAYSGGLAAIWLFARALVARDAVWNGTPRPSRGSIDLLVIYVLIGSALGGRLGFVILKPTQFWMHPMEIAAVWRGGGAFHSAVLGAGIAVWIFARRNGYPFLTVADVCALGAALGVFFGRIANFIKPELWGRPTNVPWAMVFPGAGAIPRHPSQLYEAVLEGLVVFAMLIFAIRFGALRWPGFVAGLFALAYGVARIVCECFREPDPDLPAFFYGITMGMVLSIPMVLLGAAVMLAASRRESVSA